MTRGRNVNKEAERWRGRRREGELKVDDVTRAIIGAAIEVHRHLGPGLLESAYEQCLCRELSLRRIPFEHQRQLPVEYKGLLLDCSYRLDFVVMDLVVVELKAIDALQRVHEAQLLTYLRLGQWPAGLLINFNQPTLQEGLRRLIWNPQ